MDIQYDNEKIYYINENKEVIIINDNFPSKPEISLDGNKAIYISPSEWETIGEVFLFDFISKENIILFKHENTEYTPKRAIWIDNYKIAMIIGFSMGTVAIGGNVYLLDINTKNIEKITDFNDRVQVTKIKLNGNVLELKGIEYKDNQFLESSSFEGKINIE